MTCAPTILIILLALAMFFTGCSQPSRTIASSPPVKQPNATRTLASLPAGPSVTLAWNAVTNALVAGYNIYYGMASGSYNNVSSVGNVTNATIVGLAAGGTYYFAATTVGSNGLESGYSNELSYTVPCTNCPDIETNYLFAKVWQLSCQTDVVYWPVFTKWTNNLPGYPTAFFRLLSTSNNLWQAQISPSLQTPAWSNIFGTVLSSRIPRLALTNTASFCVATNVTTNFDTGQTNPLPIPQLLTS